MEEARVRGYSGKIIHQSRQPFGEALDLRWFLAESLAAWSMTLPPYPRTLAFSTCFAKRSDVLLYQLSEALLARLLALDT